MTPEQQRVAIAEACGWKFVGAHPSMKCVSLMCWVRPGNPDWMSEQPFDYLNDLNAMREAEKVLNEDQRYTYGETLA